MCRVGVPQENGSVKFPKSGSLKDIVLCLV